MNVSTQIQGNENYYSFESSRDAPRRNSHQDLPMKITTRVTMKETTNTHEMKISAQMKLNVTTDINGNENDYTYGRGHGAHGRDHHPDLPMKITTRVTIKDTSHIKRNENHHTDDNENYYTHAWQWNLPHG